MARLQHLVFWKDILFFTYFVIFTKVSLNQLNFTIHGLSTATFHIDYLIYQN